MRRHPLRPMYEKCGKNGAFQRALVRPDWWKTQGVFYVETTFSKNRDYCLIRRVIYVNLRKNRGFPTQQKFFRSDVYSRTFHSRDYISKIL